MKRLGLEQSNKLALVALVAHLGLMAILTNSLPAMGTNVRQDQGCRTGLPSLWHFSSHLAQVGGSAARTTIQTLTFNDEEAIAPLTQLQASYLNAAIYLCGTLAVDFPEDIKVSLDPSPYPVIEVGVSNVKLRWCPIESVLVYLKDQYAVGTLTAKIITPKPSSYLVLADFVERPESYCL